MLKIFRAVVAGVILAGSLGWAGCSRGGDGLVIYSGRNKNLVGPLLDKFERDTGIDIQVKYSDTGEALATLLEEGQSTNADVFLSQDAGALGILAERGRLVRLPQDLLDLVDERFRHGDGRWVGVTGRARVIAYNTDILDVSEVPDSALDVVDPKWKGKVGFPPTNASFIAFVASLREQFGHERARAFLQGLKDNDAKRYDNNLLTLDAIANGEVQLGLVNHYYLHAELKERGDAPVANHYPGQEPGQEGTFVNVSGLGILKGTDRSEDADRFVRYLLGPEAQAFFRDETAEYPMRKGVDALSELPALDQLRTVDIQLSSIGDDLKAAVQLIKDVGLS
ncbi:MAG: iron ABC transporter substrate-binding protein [Actinobacteria bacterium]|nr:iron ABC transporter substrate-binding protein [Actinomycetota bacterium]MBW3650371.1 iron ABC transporter substrate-binding protein [Actinomycetota bacterium]